MLKLWQRCVQTVIHSPAISTIPRSPQTTRLKVPLSRLQRQRQRQQRLNDIALSMITRGPLPGSKYFRKIQGVSCIYHKRFSTLIHARNVGMT